MNPQQTPADPKSPPAPAAVAPGVPKLEAALSLLRTEEQRRAARALYWREMALSLWAPVTVFGAAFGLYVLTVELSTPPYLWAHPLLRGLGAIMLAWSLALIV